MTKLIAKNQKGFPESGCATEDSDRIFVYCMVKILLDDGQDLHGSFLFSSARVTTHRA